MSLTSRLAAAEDGLLAAIAGRANLAAVPKRLGDPGSGVRPEHIWIAEEATAEQLSDLSSQDVPTGGREENFSLRVVVLVSRSGDDYKALRDRLTALVLEVEEAVRLNRRLGGAVEDSEVERLERTTGAVEGARMAQMNVWVRARAWLA